MSDQFQTVKHVVYMEDIEDNSQPSLADSSSNWVIESFSNVEKLGQQAPVPADMPKPGDLAVIMYTSGSTGLPKVILRCGYPGRCSYFRVAASYYLFLS